jgi:hypothetical protein
VRRAAGLFIALLLSRSSLAEVCRDAPAQCAFRDGKAALKSDPREAARLLYSSYHLEPRPDTLALYAYALHQGHRYAAAREAFTRAKIAFQAELATTQRAFAAASAKHDSEASAAAQAHLEDLQRQLENVDSELGVLESLTARVRLRYAAGEPPAGLVIAHRGEGDVQRPFTELVIVNAGDDALAVTYPDGRSKEFPLALSGGADHTVVIPAEDAAPTPQPLPVAPVRDAASLASSSSHVGRWVGAGLLGVGVVSAGLGGFVYYDAHQAYEKSGCAESGSCPNSAAKDAGQRATDRMNIALGISIGGGVLAVTGLVLTIADPGHSSRAASVAAHFQITSRPDGFTALLRGSF